MNEAETWQEGNTQLGRNCSTTSSFRLCRPELCGILDCTCCFNPPASPDTFLSQEGFHLWRVTLAALLQIHHCELLWWVHCSGVILVMFKTGQWLIIREPEATGKTLLQPSFCSSKGQVRAQVSNFKRSLHWTKLCHFLLMSFKCNEAKQRGTYLYSSHAPRYAVNSILLLEVFIWVLNLYSNNNGELFSGFKDQRLLKSKGSTAWEPELPLTHWCTGR